MGGIIAAVCAALAWAGCGKSSKTKPPSVADAAAQGRVTALVGEVTATRGTAAPRALAVGAEVFADDIVRTGVGASVSIQFSTGGTFELGAERERALAQVIASLAAMPSTGASPEADLTAAAGRHAEDEAAGTLATANADPPKPGGGGGNPDDDARRKALEDYVKRQGTLKIIGGGSGSDGDIADVLRGDGETPADGNKPADDKKPVPDPTSGAANTDDVRKSMAKGKRQLASCYEKELVRDPKLATKLTLSFSIGKQGTVTAASVTEATPRVPTLEACVIAVIKKLQFAAPAGDGEVRVNYPLVFAPPAD